MSLGLLLGSKVTGIVVAALLGGPALVALVISRLRGRKSGSVRRARASARAVPSRAQARDLRTVFGAALAMLGAGGIWLVRNWWVWGSPVVPNGLTIFGITLFPGAAYEATTYLSVLGDLTEKPGYDLWNRARHFISVWLSPWYLIGAAAAGLIPIDALVSRWRGVSPSPVARLWAAVAVCGTGAVMTQFLIGAPWTSLEWTEGFSLRYGLPWLALVPVIAWTGVFPASLPWYRRAPLAVPAGLAISFGSLAILGSQPQLPFPPSPALGSLLAALAFRGALGASRLVSSRATSALAASAALAASITFASWAGPADAHAQQARAAALASGPRTLGERIYDAATTVEARDGQSCAAGRRFFVTNRFDDPGALQGSRLSNQVFYAGREVRVTAAVRPAMGPCDYIITERPIMGTDKGAALHAALNTSGRLVEVATVDDVVLLVHR